MSYLRENLYFFMLFPLSMFFYAFSAFNFFFQLFLLFQPKFIEIFMLSG